MNRWVPLTLVLMMLVVTALPVAGQRPDPHSREKGPASATAEATVVDAGCDLVEPYTAALYTTIDESGAFADFFYTADVTFGDISAKEANEIMSDGEAMIEGLKLLDVPMLYTEAHENVLIFLHVQIDMARFFGIDSSVVPDILSYEKALDVISQGEAALIDACPAQMKAVGGYILVNPSDVDVPADPDNMPD